MSEGQPEGGCNMTATIASTAHEPTSAARGAAGRDEFCPRTTAAEQRHEQRDSRDERHAERASRRRAEDVRRARLGRRQRRRTSARPPSDYLGRMAAA